MADTINKETGAQEVPTTDENATSIAIINSQNNPNAATQTKKQKKSLPESLTSVIESTTRAYIKELNVNNLPEPREIEKALLAQVNSMITLENMNIPSIPGGKDKDGNTKYTKERDRWPTLNRLVPLQVVMLIKAFTHIVRIDTAEDGIETEEDLLGVYIDDPGHPNYGLYDTNESTLYRLAQQYDRQLNKLKFKDVQFIIHQTSPRMKRCSEKDLVPVNNGIFNYATKQLEPFTHEKIFLAKTRVNYVPNVTNPVIYNPDDNTHWDVESWMTTLSDDPEIVKTLWRTLGCIVRPFVSWNKAVWLYSTVGNNGKGTLCKLMRNLCGDGSHVSIALSDFDKEFRLQPLIHATAIIVDENNVGEFIDKSKNLKAVITGDIVSINRKFQSPIDFRFQGFMVQCINELPRAKDKSDSFYRRQILIPMDKCFTGSEREYIKDDYLCRKEVLEYVLHRVLNVDTFYRLDAPGKSKELLDTYKTKNDPIRDYIKDFEDIWTWHLLPTDFLYDLYIAWYSRFNPKGFPEGRNSFKAQLEQLIANDPNSKWAVASNPVYYKGKIVDPEPLIHQYNLQNWKNAAYRGNDINQICLPIVSNKDRGRGLVRKSIMSQSNAETGGKTIAENKDTPIE